MYFLGQFSVRGSFGSHDETRIIDDLEMKETEHGMGLSKNLCTQKNWVSKKKAMIDGWLFYHEDRLQLANIYFITYTLHRTAPYS